MTTKACAAAFACALSPLLAQVTVDVSALTPIAVGAIANGTVPASFVGVPQGAPANTLSLQTAGGPANGASFTVVRNSTAAAVGFTVSARALFVLSAGVLRAGGTSASPSAAGSSLGPVEVLGRFLGTPGTTGRVRLLLNRGILPIGTPAPLASIASGLADVGNDGTAELTGPSPGIEIPVTIGASGELPVRVRAEALLATLGGGNVFVTVRVDFLPDPVATCTITPYGSPCNGASSNGSAVDLGTIRAVTLLSAGGFAQAPVLSLFGSQNIGPTLPGGCALLTDAAIVVPLVSDPVGAAVHAFTLPVTASGTLFHQFVPLDLAAFAFRASNGLEIACVP
jgi:hypothetical protein